MQPWRNRIISFVVAFASLGALAAETKKSPQRLVELQWGEAENAAQYVVEVRHFQGQLLKTFTSKKPLLKFKAPIGDYEIRAKVEGIDGRVGEFSEWNRITVLPRAVAFKDKPTQKVVDADSNKLTGHFKISWPPEETAKKYHLKVYALDDSVVLDVMVDSPNWEFDLPPGEYHYTITTVSGDFISDEIPANQTLIVGKAQLAQPEMLSHGMDADKIRPSLNWKAIQGVDYKMKLAYHPYLAEEFESIPPQGEIKDGRWSAPLLLPPGLYRWTLWAEAKGWRPSPPVIEEFEIKPTEPILSSVDKELDPQLKDDE